MPRRSAHPRSASPDSSDTEGPRADKPPASRRFTEENLPLIKVVGLSGSGKSTLVCALRVRGYNARPVSQEHSHIPDLWQQFDRPLFLIYLSVDASALAARRPESAVNVAEMQEETLRIAHARDHADLRLDTSNLTPDAVARLVLAFLHERRVRHADRSLPPISPTGAPRTSS